MENTEERQGSSQENYGDSISHNTTIQSDEQTKNSKQQKQKLQSNPYITANARVLKLLRQQKRAPKRRSLDKPPKTISNTTFTEIVEENQENAEKEKGEDGVSVKGEQQEQNISVVETRGISAQHSGRETPRGSIKLPPRSGSAHRSGRETPGGSNNLPSRSGSAHHGGRETPRGSIILPPLNEGKAQLSTPAGYSSPALRYVYLREDEKRMKKKGNTSAYTKKTALDLITEVRGGSLLTYTGVQRLEKEHIQQTAERLSRCDPNKVPNARRVMSDIVADKCGMMASYQWNASGKKCHGFTR